MIEATKPHIGRGGQKILGKTRGRGLSKDIEAIFTVIGKKNCLGYEILDIEKRIVKLKKDTIFTIKLLNR
jgi:hypothetical protein